jgi:hypothetical protein
VTRFESPHVQVRVDSTVQAMLERAGWSPPPGTGSALARDESGCPCEFVDVGDPSNPRKILGRTVPTCPTHGSDA